MNDELGEDGADFEMAPSEMSSEEAARKTSDAKISEGAVPLLARLHRKFRILFGWRIGCPLRISSIALLDVMIMRLR